MDKAKEWEEVGEDPMFIKLRIHFIIFEKECVHYCHLNTCFAFVCMLHK